MDRVRLLRKREKREAKRRHERKVKRQLQELRDTEIRNKGIDPKSIDGLRLRTSTEGHKMWEKRKENKKARKR